MTVPALLPPSAASPSALPRAGWGLRLAAHLLDGLCAAPLLLLLLVSPGLYQLSNVVVVLLWGWRTGTTGQTLGKRVVGTRVVRQRDGELLGPRRGVARSLLHLLDAVSLLGYLWPLWDRQRQTFADKLVGSVVVRT